MTYLLSISIGPVQPFIEAARRTADLTAGSRLLVDIAMAVAGSIAATPTNRLIFPAQDDAGKITDGPNKILAEVAGDPRSIVEQARAVATDVLRSAWTAALSERIEFDDHTTAPLQDYVIKRVADDQVANFLEFYAAWVPLDRPYATARTDVEQLLAGRKALRAFSMPESQNGIFKSPLDPSRDSVLADARPDAKDPPYAGQPSLYLKKAEHLDAVSLIKRVLGRQTGHVKSTTQLSATALMKDLEKKAPAETKALKDYAKRLPSGVREEDLLYPGRRADAAAAGEIVKDDQHDQPAQAKDLAEAVLKRAGYGIAPPDWASYYAILCADGDRMGKLLGKMTTPDDHIEFSRKLSGFADQATTIVAGHGGHCVYSGGDDVVALLPAHTALDCAAKLAAEFKSAVNGTLSVGVAIVHHMDPLRISLERARDAEREAKKERNSLAVALHTRGGEPRVVAEKWLAGHDLTNWTNWIAAFRAEDGLSRGFPYELRHLAREARELFAGDPSKPAVVLESDTLKAEALRILERKKGGKDEPGKAHSFDLPALKNAIESANSPDELENLVAKLIICRFLAQYPV